MDLRDFNVCKPGTARRFVVVVVYKSCILITCNVALPFNDYFQYFGPDYRLEVPATNMENMNSREYLDKIKYAYSSRFVSLFLTKQPTTTKRTKILENLRHLNFAPSVQMHQVPKDLFSDDDEDEDNEENKDKRITRKSFSIICLFSRSMLIVVFALYCYFRENV